MLNYTGRSFAISSWRPDRGFHNRAISTGSRGLTYATLVTHFCGVPMPVSNLFCRSAGRYSVLVPAKVRSPQVAA